jgi:cytochrome c nitrite reductase small subunit
MRSSKAPFVIVAVLAGIAFGVGGYAFIYAKGYSYLLNDPAACSNCHAMRTQYDAWMKSSHHSSAACNDCHTPHNLVGKYAVKASNGFFHSLYFTSGKYPDNIRITEFDLKVTESACRRCHQSITQAIDGKTAHSKAAGTLCTRCHYSVGHSDESARLHHPRFLEAQNHGR